MELSTAAIGAAGELLTQYRLLSNGVEASRLPTDSGIDLVAFAPSMMRPVTIQVKANRAPKPSGGKGSPCLNWWLRINSPAELVALADLASDRVWLFTHAEFVRHAQQNSSGKAQLYLYVNDDYEARPGCHVREFENFLLENRIAEIFGVK